MPREDVDSNQEDIEVTPVLHMLAALLTIKEQASDPQTEADKLYGREEWALIQQKVPDLMQVQCYLSRKHKPTS